MATSSLSESELEDINVEEIKAFKSHCKSVNPEDELKAEGIKDSFQYSYSFWYLFGAGCKLTHLLDYTKCLTFDDDFEFHVKSSIPISIMNGALDKKSFFETYL
jgi:hypothetical protein